MHYIQNLNLTTYLLEDKEGSELDVAMWGSPVNICEYQDDDCITTHGLYFGTSDSREPKFCPRHFFGQNTYAILEVAK